jgi:GNAT superfamily N-acetyltransferase
VDHLIRPATTSDLTELAAAARASGLSDIEGGADPRYVTHLIEHGRLLVAQGPDGIAGYAGSIAAGPAVMLTDLFIRPDVRSGGIGAGLLAQLFSGVGHRMTHSSKDPRAVALYARNGMAPLMPILYLRGNPGAINWPGPWRLVEVTAGTAAAADTAITGADRLPTYEYWTARPNSRAFCLLAADTPVAAGVLGGEGDEYGLTHLAVAPDVDAAQAVCTAVAAVPGGPGQPVQFGLPGPHPALPHLLAAGFHIVDTDTFMTSGPNPYTSGLAIGSAGLC